MSHQLMTAPDVHDVVVCGNCGQPIWEPQKTDTCERCKSRKRANACSLFLLNDFTAATARAFQESFNR